MAVANSGPENDRDAIVRETPEAGGYTPVMRGPRPRRRYAADPPLSSSAVFACTPLLICKYAERGSRFSRQLYLGRVIAACALPQYLDISIGFLGSLLLRIDRYKLGNVSC